MPCIYAHNSFGKEVQKMLPKPLKNTIRRHPAAFRIGLQGPDFLFFYHHIPYILLHNNSWSKTSYINYYYSTK